MKTKALTPSSKLPKVVPPLTVEMTFETEAEMQSYRAKVGPMNDPLSVFFGVFELVGDHLLAHTGRRDNR